MMMDLANSSAHVDDSKKLRNAHIINKSYMANAFLNAYALRGCTQNLSSGERCGRIPPMSIFENPAFVLFLVLFVGLALGNISIKGISLGSSGVLFAALAAGHFGLRTPEGVADPILWDGDFRLLRRVGGREPIFCITEEQGKTTRAFIDACGGGGVAHGMGTR